MQTQTVNSKIEKAIHHVANQVEDKDVTVKVSVTKEKRAMKPINPFVILFYDNFQKIIKEHKLNPTEILVVLEILKTMTYGNLISISQTEIAANLDIPRQNVNRAFGKFRKSGLLVKSDLGSEYINNQVIAKGNLWEHRDLQELYQTSLEVAEAFGLSKSF